jgi:hypothetical protein
MHLRFIARIHHPIPTPAGRHPDHKTHHHIPPWNLRCQGAEIVTPGNFHVAIVCIYIHEVFDLSIFISIYLYLSIFLACKYQPGSLGKKQK